MQMPDHGPIYRETLNYHELGGTGWPVEPWNSLSSLLFLVVVLYWTVRLWGEFRHHRFMGYALVVLFVGGVGGFLYHSLRTDVIYLFMDWFPIAVLTVTIAFWYIWKLVGRLWLAVLISVLSYVIIFGGFIMVHEVLDIARRSISLGYVIAALYIATPIILYMRKTGYRDGGLVWQALAFFGLAVISRIVDMEAWLLPWLPMGTHFLWHVFGVLATHCLLSYVYRSGNMYRPAV